MNQDFALLATPSLARRLLLLQSISKLDLPESLAALAEQDRVQESDFDPLLCPFTAERAAVVQFLLDNSLRGIVQAVYHPCMDEATMLRLFRLAGAEKVSILTRRIATWRKQVETTSWTKDIAVHPMFGITGSWIDQRRDGALLIDLCDESGLNEHSLLQRFTREFPQVIVYQPLTVSVRHLTHWSLLAATLFPTLPHPATVRLAQDNPPHWKTLKFSQFAWFYNTCIFPQHIKSGRLLATLEDVYLDGVLDFPVVEMV